MNKSLHRFNHTPGFSPKERMENDSSEEAQASISPNSWGAHWMLFTGEESKHHYYYYYYYCCCSIMLLTGRFVFAEFKYLAPL